MRKFLSVAVILVFLFTIIGVGLAQGKPDGVGPPDKGKPPIGVESPVVWDGRGSDSLNCGKDGDGPRDKEEGWIHWVFSTVGEAVYAELTLSGTGSGIFIPYESPAAVWHFFTPYYEIDGLLATLTFEGKAGTGGGLVISDYCPGEITIDPIDPVDPIDPIDPIDPVDPADPIDPVDPVELIDPVDPADPVEPVEPVIEPIIPDDPVEPIEPIISEPILIQTPPETTPELPRTGANTILQIILGSIMTLTGTSIILKR